MIFLLIEVIVGSLQGEEAPSYMISRLNVIDSVVAPGKIPAVPSIVNVSVYDRKIY